MLENFDLKDLINKFIYLLLYIQSKLLIKIDKAIDDSHCIGLDKQSLKW